MGIDQGIRFEVRPATDPDARWCLEQYFAELDARFEAGFDSADALAEDPDALSPPSGLFVVAVLDGAPMGCVGLTFHRPDLAEIKRMWVAPAGRGRGLGRGLLAEAERRAAAHGCRTAQLDTNRVLDEAIALYRSSGYAEIGRYSDNPYAHHWFEKTLPASGDRAAG